MTLVKPPEALIEVLPDKATLIDRAYTHVLARLNQAIAQHGKATIALSGGSTPKPLYERLVQASLPWDKVHVFWGDERYVAPDHPDSNYRMAREAWLDHVDLPSDNIHPMPTTAADPEVDAQTYAEELQTFFPSTDQEWPQFDVMLMGMGDDGHTASLFPQTAALDVHNRSVTVGNKDGQPRITLTLPVINHANFILFMVAGANKQTALDQVFAPTAEARQYPSRFVQATGDNLLWLLDQAAAEGIPNTIEMHYLNRSS